MNNLKCVTCIIRNEENKVLVLEHMKCKNKFTLPAGTMEQNEIEKKNGYKITVRREMEEELGINISINDISLVEKVWSYYDRIDGHKIYREYVCDISDYSGKIINKEPHKHPSMKWVTFKEVFNSPEIYTYQTWRVITEYYM